MPFPQDASLRIVALRLSYNLPGQAKRRPMSAVKLLSSSERAQAVPARRRGRLRPQ